MEELFENICQCPAHMKKKKMKTLRSAVSSNAVQVTERSRN